MSSLKLSKKCKSDSTVISNLFIDEYMKDANDAQLKIYLYLTRVINANLAVSVPEIADKFNHTERDVMRSLKYWEKQGLMSLDYDENKNLIGVELLEGVRPAESGVAEPAVPAPAVPAVQKVAENVTPAVPKESAPAPRKETVSPVPAKPVYKNADFLAFREDPETAELLFIIETYLNRQLTRDDISGILYIHNTLQFCNDLTDYLVQFCVSRQATDMRFIENTAVLWMQHGIRTVKEAKKFVKTSDANYTAIMKTLGREAYPTDKEREFMNRWLEEYGFSQEMVLMACERAAVAVATHRFSYTDGILANWRKAGVTTPEELASMEATYASGRRKTSERGNVTPFRPRESSKTAFASFPQNEYNFDELEKEILSNNPLQM